MLSDPYHQSGRIQRKRKSLQFVFSKGISLIEILIVVAILGVLFGVLVPLFSKSRVVAERAACQANLRTLQLAAVSFIMDNNKFPDWQQWYFSAPTGFRNYFSASGAGHTDRFTTVATSPLLQRRWPSYSPVSHTYAMNYRVSSHKDAIVSWQAIQEPHRMVHFMFGAYGDERADGSYFYTPFLYHMGASNPGSIARERYYDEGYSNIVYTDGHVNRISRAQGRALARHNDEESRLFWRGVR